MDDIVNYAYANGLMSTPEKELFNKVMHVDNAFTAGLIDIESLVVPDLYYNAIEDVYKDWIGKDLTEEDQLALKGDNKGLYPLFSRALWDHTSGYHTTGNMSFVVASPFTDWIRDELVGTNGPLSEIKYVFSVFLLKIQNTYNFKLAQYNLENNLEEPYLEVHLLHPRGSIYKPKVSYDIIWANNGVLIDYDAIQEFGNFIVVNDDALDLYDIYKAAAQEKRQGL